MSICLHWHIPLCWECNAGQFDVPVLTLSLLDHGMNGPYLHLCTQISFSISIFYLVMNPGLQVSWPRVPVVRHILLSPFVGNVLT